MYLLYFLCFLGIGVLEENIMLITLFAIYPYTQVKKEGCLTRSKKMFKDGKDSLKDHKEVIHKK